jgi:hypothetical protein
MELLELCVLEEEEAQQHLEEVLVWVEMADHQMLLVKPLPLVILVQVGEEEPPTATGTLIVEEREHQEHYLLGMRLDKMENIEEEKQIPKVIKYVAISLENYPERDIKKGDVVGEAGLNGMPNRGMEQINGSQEWILETAHQWIPVYDIPESEWEFLE